MRTWTDKEIANLDQVKRLHLINSITGIKPANLIATENPEGQCNLGIFSSVVHLGSQPALLGFVLRPSMNGNRHTYENIKSTGIYTINAVDQNCVDKAHYTSAPFDREACEFAEVGLNRKQYDGFDGIFVKESPIQIGMEFLQEIPIEANQTRLIVGEVKFVAIQDSSGAIDPINQLDLSKLNLSGISGLNRYYSFEHLAEFDQARVGEFPVNKKISLHLLN
ncbi:flavin reductase family protein [Thiomicrorhabdus indica]|uniref:flavin reductase family protein n=1 Tax=Thiomicrorhabdus indica TaxID=2267253 RepID=UPI002AA84176|nr:flavin reductase [Thiomicrorhabdus indica]